MVKHDLIGTAHDDDDMIFRSPLLMLCSRGRIFSGISFLSFHLFRLTVLTQCQLNDTIALTFIQINLCVHSLAFTENVYTKDVTTLL